MVVPAYYGFFGRFNILEGNSFRTRRTFIHGRGEIKYANSIIFVDISTSLAVICVAVGLHQRFIILNLLPGDFTFSKTSFHLKTLISHTSLDIIKSIYFRNTYFHTCFAIIKHLFCLLYTSPSPRDKRQSRMPSSA